MSFRNRFSKVGIVNGKLTLSRNSLLLSLHMEHNSLAWRQSPGVQSQQLANLVSFELLSSSETQRGYRLEKATLHGCHIFLDGRGLLHLKSVRTGTPEVTMVLKDGVTSGYCSNHKWFGELAYIEHQPACEIERIYDNLRALDIGIE